VNFSHFPKFRILGCDTASSPKLKSLQDLSIRIKSYATEESVDHVSLWVNGGTKFPHRVLESSNSLHHPLCLVSTINNIPLKGVIPVRVPCRGGGSCSMAEPERTMWVVRTTVPLVLWVSILITIVPLGRLRVSLWFGGVMLCCLYTSTSSYVSWAWVAMAHVYHPYKLQS
jgi:hypothetical protein